MKLKASAANQWMACPGSVKLQKEFPEPEGADKSSAEEGVAAHWVAEGVLRDSRVEVYPEAGLVAPNGVVITEEILDAVRVYTQAVRDDEPPVGIHVEEKILSVELDNVAYVDLYYCKAEERELVIWDFKYGRTLVEVFMNWQLIAYALTLNAKFHARTIIFHIVQPRAFHPDGAVRTWSFSADRLPAFRIELNDQAALARSDTPPTVAGAPCKNCTARHACATLQRGASLDIGTSQVNVITPEHLGAALVFSAQQKRLVDAWDSGLQAHAQTLIKAGTSVPGWGLKPTQGTVKWEKSVTEVEQMGAIFGKDVLQEKKLITPGQAKKLGIPESVVDAVSKRYTGLKLTPVNLDKISETFK